MRTVEDPLVAAAVHNIDLYPGGQWFSRVGVQPGPDGRPYIQCVLGEGAAGVLGADIGKPGSRPATRSSWATSTGWWSGS